MTTRRIIVIVETITSVKTLSRTWTAYSEENGDEIIMIKKDIQLTTVERVKDFVNTVAEFDFEVDLISGRYHVNGKSIMGIFSLDLTKGIQLEAEAPADQEGAFLKAIEPLLA